MTATVLTSGFLIGAWRAVGEVISGADWSRASTEVRERLCSGGLVVQGEARDGEHFALSDDDRERNAAFIALRDELSELVSLRDRLPGLLESARANQAEAERARRVEALPAELGDKAAAKRLQAAKTKAAKVRDRLADLEAIRDPLTAKLMDVEARLKAFRPVRVFVNSPLACEIRNGVVEVLGRKRRPGDLVRMSDAITLAGSRRTLWLTAEVGHIRIVQVPLGEEEPASELEEQAA